jgi:rhodanese-related sulfurtransferase
MIVSPLRGVRHHDASRALQAIAALVLSVSAAFALDVPKDKQTKLGEYLSAKEAYDVVKTERDTVLFVDIRIRGEVQYVGYPNDIDGHVPFAEMSPSGAWDDKGTRFKLEANAQFSSSIEALLAKKGLTKSDKIVLICRSGDRSKHAADLLADNGYSNVWNQIDGFEGDLSPEGRRTVNGWKNDGLPWTYKFDPSKMAVPVK